MPNDADVKAALFESFPVMVYTMLCFDVARQMFPERPFIELDNAEAIEVHKKLASVLFVMRQTLSLETGMAALGFLSASQPQSGSVPDPRPGPYL